MCIYIHKHIYIWPPPWLSGEESTCSIEDAEDTDLVPGSGRSPGGGNSNLLQYSCLENPMHGGAWWAYSSKSTVQPKIEYSFQERACSVSSFINISKSQNKLQRYIKKHREYSQYFIIIVNGIWPLKIVSLSIVHLTYNCASTILLIKIKMYPEETLHFK